MNRPTDSPPIVGTADAGRRPFAIVAVVGGFALQLLVGVPFTIASGLVAPLWAMALLYVLWIVSAAVAVGVARRRPLMTPVVPVVNAALLWLAITAGEQLLGWTA